MWQLPRFSESIVHEETPAFRPERGHFPLPRRAECRAVFERTTFCQWVSLIETVGAIGTPVDAATVIGTNSTGSASPMVEHARLTASHSSWRPRATPEFALLVDRARPALRCHTRRREL